MPERGGLVDALVAAPLGAALLALVEGAARDDVHWWEIPPDSDPGAVSMAADAVHAWPFGSLVRIAVYASYMQVGPWVSSSAGAAAAAAYRGAEARVPIAEAIEASFGDELHRPLDATAQEWWNSSAPAQGLHARPRFVSFESVYGAGQFTWAGVWTVTRPPSESHGELVAAWEMEPSPVSRWRLPVRPGARVAEIHRPEDWAALVATHPASARPDQECWELPGPNQDVSRLVELLSFPGQRAALTSTRHHLVPDWAGVATELDGVHLSWAGFITSEGCVTDLGSGDVTMLRYWFSERTHWLRDVFGEPEPLAAPDLDPDGTSLSGLDARTDEGRRRHDRAILTAQLGR